jgi:UDP-N-acetyl-D-mannosaminuronic acid dehydrogenase
MMMIPGAGVGGHCLPKDSWLLKYGVDHYGKFQVTPNVIVESRKINDYMPNHMKTLIIEALKENQIKLSEAKIVILGYAFLENSDDTRNTPAYPLYKSLENICQEIIVHDPYVKQEEGIIFSSNFDEAISSKDIIAIVTKHEEYYNINLDRLKKKMRTPIIIDGRNIINEKDAIEIGFTFRGVGIGTRIK